MGLGHTMRWLASDEYTANTANGGRKVGTVGRLLHTGKPVF